MRAVPSIYSSARTELDSSPVCRHHAYMIDVVVSKNTNELKTCISQSVSYRRVYACFAKRSWNAWS